MSEPASVLRIGPVLRYGDGVARSDEGDRLLPFMLPGELIELADAQNADTSLARVLEASPQRVQPGCPHFGPCGGCQLQNASYPEQLRCKHDVLLDWLERAGLRDLPAVKTHAAEPWEYRNRIRLRVGRDHTGALRFGFNERASHRFLPISTCPISARLLWSSAEALLAQAGDDADTAAWLALATEAELFCDGDQQRLQLQLLLENKSTPPNERAFMRAMDLFRQHVPQLAGAGVAVLGAQQRVRERTRTPLFSYGAAGLAYDVADERYWVARGGFFQVNRFLLPQLVELVCGERTGALAWDLFAGVGLFARVLAKRFAQVTAVEGNALAARDLQTSLSKLGTAHRAVQQPTLEFLQHAVLQRERPDLITLDPPRAGAGEAACELLLRLAAPLIVYVSCDPETLARDLAVLTRGYRIAELHLVDMFPQTYHQETVVVLERNA